MNPHPRQLPAAAVLVAALAGPPVLLVNLTGWPHRPRPPDGGRLLTRIQLGDLGPLLVPALTYLTWAAWALLTILILVEIAAAATGHHAPHLPGVAGPQRAITHLVTAAVATLIGLCALTGRAAAAAPAQPATAATTAPAQPGTGQHATPRPQRPAVPVYRVRRGDTLWSIAARHLGDPLRWPEIAHLNDGLTMTDGATFRSADWIMPGWHLHLPADATGLPGPGRSSGHQHRTHHRATRPDHHEQHRHRAPTPAPTGTHARHPPTASPPGERATGPPSHGVHGDQTTWSAIAYASGAGVSLATAITGAAALASARRRKQPGHTPQDGEEDEPAMAVAARDEQLSAHTHPDLPGRDAAHAELGRPQPLLAPPGRLIIGTRDGIDVRYDLPAAGGLGLEGPGAGGALRAMIAGLMAENAAGQTEIHLTSHLATDLLDLAGDRNPLDALRLADSPDTLLEAISAEIVQRARALDDDIHNDQSFCGSVTAFRAHHPEYPLPALVVIATPTTAEQLKTHLPDATRYDWALLAAGECPDGTTATIDAHGAVTAATGPAADTLTGLHMATMPTREARDLLELAADPDDQYLGHDEPPPPEPATPDTTAATPDPDPPVGSPPEQQPPDGEGTRADDPDDGGTESDETAASPADPVCEVDATRHRRPVELRVLGPATVYAAGEEVARGLRRDARDLLALLALHRDGIRIDTAYQHLWPDTDPLGAGRFHTALTNIRRALRGRIGAPHAMIITRASGRYRLDPHLTGCDLWDFTDHRAAAATAGDPARRCRALSAAIDAYTGPLLDGDDHAWVHAERAAHARQAADTCVQAAQLADEPQATTHLEHATAIEPDNEALHQMLIRHHGEDGRPDAAHRTYQHLRDHLATLGVVPDSATDQVLADATDPTLIPAPDAPR